MDSSHSEEYTEEATGKGEIGTNKFTITNDLRNHIKNIDTSVPRKRGIGGAHNRDVFMQNNIKIII